MFIVADLVSLKIPPSKIEYFMRYMAVWRFLDCVAAVERLPALHYSVDFIFLSFGIMGFIMELCKLLEGH